MFKAFYKPFYFERVEGVVVMMMMMVQSCQSTNQAPPSSQTSKSP